MMPGDDFFFHAEKKIHRSCCGRRNFLIESSRGPGVLFFLLYVGGGLYIVTTLFLFRISHQSITS